MQAILAARIDRLAPDEKALLQQLAVIGRQFPVSLLRQVLPYSEADLYRLLASLQRKEFLYEQPAFPEVEYIFKHALTQEVAYGTVLQEQRKLLHERTGQALEALYGTTLHEHYSDLAHHYRRSPNLEKAIAYLQLAGQQAGQRSDHAEAITQLTSALELLKTLPGTPTRDRQELTLQLSLGPAFVAQGWAAPEIEKAYTRARELCQQVEETTQLFPILWGLWLGYAARPDYKTAQELAGQCLDLAHRSQDPSLCIEASYIAGVTWFCLGEFSKALEHFEQSITLYHPQQHSSLASLYGGQDPGVLCRTDAAWNLWFLGYPDQALKKTNEALTLAQDLSHPFSLSVAFTLAAVFHQLSRNIQATQEQAEAAITLASEQGLPFYLAWGKMLRGWALVERGYEEEGTAQIREGLTFPHSGGEFMRSWTLTLLAEAHAKRKQAQEGLGVLTEALTMVDKTGERFYEAELYRIKGTLTFQLKIKSGEWRAKEAEGCFLRAIEIAQKQQAKSLELRAVMSLARLWQQQGKTAEARQRLAEIYGWFTEGFDPKDLQEAKKLLEEFAGIVQT